MPLYYLAEEQGVQYIYIYICSGLDNRVGLDESQV